MIYELKEELIMILKNHIITDISINQLDDLHKLKPFWEDGTLKINKSQIARELKVVGNKPLQAFKCPEENPLGFGFHLLCKIGIVGSVHGLFLGSQHKLSTVKTIATVIQGLQIAIAECHQPGEHPALIALSKLYLNMYNKY